MNDQLVGMSVLLDYTIKMLLNTLDAKDMNEGFHWDSTKKERVILRFQEGKYVKYVLV